MATDFRKILLRRGTGTPPTDLAAGELAFQTDTKLLFVGTGDASPNHYKQIANLSDLSVTSTAAELNILDGATITVAELNKLDGFTGTFEDLNYAKDLRATGVTNTEFDFLDGVTSNIQTQLNNIQSQSEWQFLAELNPATNAAITIGSSDLGGAFDNANYDYKFVINASTTASDTAGALAIQVNADSTAGRHSFVRNTTTLDSSDSATSTQTGQRGTTATQIETGLVLSGGQSAVTMLHSEFTITRSQVSLGAEIGGNVADGYVYIVKGEGSVVGGESGTTTNYASDFSLSKISSFTGAFGNGPQNLTSIRLSGFPDAGSTSIGTPADDLKIRVYKRER